MRAQHCIAPLIILALASTISAQTTTLAPVASPPPAAVVMPGDVDQPVLAFQLTATGVVTPPHNLTSVAATQTGTAVATDITRWRLFEDTDNNGLFDAGLDTPIGSPAMGAAPSFGALATELIDSTAQTFFIAVDVAPAATDGATIGLSIDNTQFTVSAGTTAGAPVVSNFLTVVVPVPTRLVVTTQPVGGSAGLPLAVQPVVEGWTSDGALEPGFTGPVTAEITAGTGTSGAVLSGTTTVNAVGGVATFTDLSIDRAGVGYTLTFRSGALMPGVSAPFSVSIGSFPGGTPDLDIRRNGKHVAIAAPPTDFVGTIPAAGIGIVYEIVNLGSATLELDATPVTIDKTNQCSVTVTQPALTTLLPGNSTTFTLHVTPASGADHFGLIYRLHSNDPASPFILSVTGEVAAGGATQLAVTTEPGGGTGGVVWTQQPVVEVRDASAAVDASFTGPVSAHITTGTGTPGATLLGTTTVNAVAGVATFTDLAIDFAGTGYTLTFTSGLLTPATSTTFDILVGPATTLYVAIQPGGAAMAAPFVTQPVVHIVDDGMNVVSSDSATMVSAAITANTGAPGALLTGTTPVMVSNGTATFTDLQIDLQGAGYTLDFTATGLTTAVSEPFGVAGAADHLAIAVQPAGAIPNTPFLHQPVIEIRDSLGTLVFTDSTTQVTATLVAGTGVLSGTLTVVASEGVATFTDLQLDTIGSGFQIEFTSVPVLTPVTSDPFGATGPAAKLVVVTQPGNATAGQAFGQQPVIEIQDEFGNVVVSDNTTILQVSLLKGKGNNGKAHENGHPSNNGKGNGNGNAKGPGNNNGKANGKGQENGKGYAVGQRRGVLSGTLVVTAVNGVVTFTDLSIDWHGWYRLQFDDVSETLDPVVSDAFKVGGPATKPEGCVAGTGATGWAALAAMLMLLGVAGLHARLVSRQ